jgi:nicotinate-nucleotide adenylyltransferase
LYKPQTGSVASRKTSIMGGTFDPVHRGHLIVAELIRSRLELETVVFVPSHCPHTRKVLN